MGVLTNRSKKKRRIPNHFACHIPNYIVNKFYAKSFSLIAIIFLQILSIRRNLYFYKVENRDISNRDRIYSEPAKRKRKRPIFLICLLLATLFWILVKLSGEYSVTYPLKVKYNHIPEGKMLVMSEDSIVNVSFKSDGYNLLDLLIEGKLKYLPIDLSRLKMEKVRNNSYAIFTQGLKEPLASRLNVNESEIIFSTPDLEVNFEDLHRRKVTIQPNLNLQFKSQYGLYHATVIPEKVTIWGPEKEVDTISSLQTSSINLKDLDEDKEVSASVKNPLPGDLKINPREVTVKLTVAKYTEFSLKVPIDVSGIDPPIRTFPATTTLYFNMFLKDYKELRTNEFKVVPDVKNVNLRSVKTLNLRIITHPKITRDVRMDPYSVEFIIVK